MNAIGNAPPLVMPPQRFDALPGLLSHALDSAMEVLLPRVQPMFQAAGKPDRRFQPPPRA